ncbi:MAG TPA: fluoride efflux transporter CrcB [Gemmatimonadales bacterium]|nr:fluoride efflux transporter CrcB [Gemmatimonadales bacterium]
MVRALLVGAGGFLGSVLRYWLSGVVQNAAPGSSFPLGTLAVNVSGCLLIGVLAELAESRGFLGPDTRALLFVGVLGGFTTFSAFANETVGALRDGAHGTAALNVLLTVAACLTAVWAGRALATLIWR